ncbi:MAG: hypothetical protein JO287_10120 [Pseudonocardiales bacterium]|nr:hypothetical protein [Pseudonocardiales bacterium]
METYRGYQAAKNPDMSPYRDGKRTAEHSDHSLVPFQTDEAIVTVIGNRDDDFTAYLTEFARTYAAVVRVAHRSLDADCG